MLARVIIILAGFVSGCANEGVDSLSHGETLGSVVRNAGFACQDVVSTEILSETNDSWRISCSQALVYVVAMDGNGDVCVEPVRFVDSVSPAPVQSPEARCISGAAL